MTIYIHKGDDTDFNDNSFLTFNIITEKDLTNWQAKFILNGLEKTFEDITSKSFELHFSDEETSQFKLGKTTNELKLIDEEGKIKTVAKNIEINITNEIIENESQIINLPILKDEGIDINISLAGGGGSGTVNHYELLYRDLADQHPISAITNLQETLDGKQNIGNYALRSEIPTKSSELENDTNYTTQTDVLALIASIPQFKLSIVETLPEVGEKMILYFVPKEGTENDIYNEYIWIEETSKFEFLGSTAVDLTDYVKKEEIANVATKDEVNTNIPLGASNYFKNIQTNECWVKSEGQFNDGTKYATFYNWLLDEKEYNTLRTDIKYLDEEYEESDYVINKSDTTFRLPLLNGSEEMSSERYVEFTLEESNSTYTVPANGYVNTWVVAGANGQYSQLQNLNTGFIEFINASGPYGLPLQIFAFKGDVVEYQYTTTNGQVRDPRFIYAKGNGTLYYYVGKIEN